MNARSVAAVVEANDRADAAEARTATTLAALADAERRAIDAEITANEILCVDQEPDVELHAAAGE